MCVVYVCLVTSGTLCDELLFCVQTFRRDSMLVFAGSQDVWLLLEVARGRHNSAAARVRLQLGSDSVVHQTSGNEMK